LWASSSWTCSSASPSATSTRQHLAAINFK
jgi:hypothetical protein